MSLRAKCRWPFVLALFVAVQVTACSMVASAWPGGGIGYPNTMIYDTWQGRTAATTMTLNGTGAVLRFGDGNVALTRLSGFGLGFTGTGGLQSALFTGNNNADVTFGQQGTSKFVIHFPTGDGAGSNADRMTIDTDKVKITTSPGTSTGVLVGADSGALDLKANAAGGATLNLLSGGTMQFNGVTAVSYVTMTNQVALVAASGQSNVWVYKGATNGTVQECRYTVEVIGAVGGTCTYDLFDATASAAIGTVSLSCTAAVGASGTFTSGGLTNGHTMDLRVTAPAGDTSAKGSMICSISY